MKPDDESLDAIFRQARLAPKAEARELGFETRLLAGIRTERKQSGIFGKIAWRLSPVFAAAAMAAGVWNFNSPATLADASLSSDETVSGISEQVLMDYFGAD